VGYFKWIHLLLSYTDHLQQVEEYARGCIWQTKKVKTIYRFGKLVFDEGDSTIESVVTCHQEEFEGTKGVIRNRISKNRKHNGQKKKDNRTNNNLQNIHIKLNIE